MPGKQCLKCGYERQGHESAPGWLCPRCGAVYAKVEAQRSGVRPKPPKSRRGRPAAPSESDQTGLLQGLTEEIRDWSQGRLWAVRVPLLLWFAYIGVQHFADPWYNSLFGGINLGIHELGHLLFQPFGQFLAVAGGTITQLAAPVIAGFLFARQPDWFAVTVSGAWLATNLYHVAAYVADARALELPLLSLGGGDAIHDWHYLLSHLGILDWDTGLATLLRGLAFLLLWASIAAGAWICWLMLTSRSSRSAP
jgi:hypothetical protein